MIRAIAATAILASQLLLLWVVFDTTGEAAIAFSFVGHPLLAIGCLLAVVRFEQRRRAEAERKRDEATEATGPG